MPYIRQCDRISFNKGLELLQPQTTGELNYIITKLLLKWIGSKISYDKYNSVLGVLRGVELELYRRQVVSYENLKCKENGDVY